MRVRFLASAVCALALWPLPCQAGDAQPLINFFLNQLDQQVQQEQQRQYNKEQQRQYNLFSEFWQRCFNLNVRDYCVSALSYPGLRETERQSLFAKISEMDNAAAIARAREEERARQEQEEQERAREVEREQQSTRQRQLEEAERARKAEEEGRLAAKNALATSTDACRRYDVGQCESALASPLVTSMERAVIRGLRETALSYGVHQKNCETGDADACNAALAFPAVAQDDKIRLMQLRTAALTADQPAPETTASLTPIKTSLDFFASLVAAVPTSTLVLAALSLLLSVAVGLLLYRNLSRHHEKGASSPEHPTEAITTTMATAQAPPAVEPTNHLAPTSQLPVVQTAPVAAMTPVVIDTPAALRALRLAHAYLQEVDLSNSTGDPEAVKSLRTTLSLAARKLDEALKADPNARLETEEEGVHCVIAINWLRSRVLVQEALSWMTENPKRAIAIARQAVAAQEDSAAAYHVLGMLLYENRDKAGAIEALTHASALDPDDIETLKLLDRATNLGAAEVLTFKATSTGIKAANAGIKTYNGFVRVWNIFAHTYNIVTFPIRFPMRLMLRLFGAVDRVF